MSHRRPEGGKGQRSARGSGELRQGAAKAAWESNMDPRTGLTKKNTCQFSGACGKQGRWGRWKQGGARAPQRPPWVGCGVSPAPVGRAHKCQGPAQVHRCTGGPRRKCAQPALRRSSSEPELCSTGAGHRRGPQPQKRARPQRAWHWARAGSSASPAPPRAWSAPA